MSSPVYDGSSFKRLADIKLEMKKGIKRNRMNVRDIASCSIQRCLYIYDLNNQVICRVMDDGCGRMEVDEWLSIRGKTSTKLSVTSDGRVLLAGWEPSRVDIYGPSAFLLRQCPITDQGGTSLACGRDTFT